MEIRRSYDRLISTMGFPILIRRHLYIEPGSDSSVWLSKALTNETRCYICHVVFLGPRLCSTIDIPDSTRYASALPSTWGKSTEHDQNAWKPRILPVSVSLNSSKIRKSTNCNHNLMTSESGQDTSACKISGHFLNGFSRKCLETPHLTRFTKSK